MVIHTLVTSRVDFCNMFYVSLQLVHDLVAQLISGMVQRYHMFSNKPGSSTIQYMDLINVRPFIQVLFTHCIRHLYDKWKGCHVYMVCSCTLMNLHTCQIWWWKQPFGFTLPTLQRDLLLSLFLLFSSEAPGKDLSKQSSYRCPSVAGHPTVLCLFSWFCYCMNSCALENKPPSFTWSKDGRFGNKEWSHSPSCSCRIWEQVSTYWEIHSSAPRR